ncbi:formate dehydrogenase subunit gamma [Woeseia oceani]|uniref:NADH-quinone oxidoreductase subunit E n=1 Tax=Woeseia oceani TaxID=1548547 RepID=A0A193LJT9_9GAMM|nr:formate dehydrogenase subunit gamma [Woeseia oceani]ANO52698.1 formate dehydrogenase subunit gamma [Woeseia oceani]
MTMNYDAETGAEIIGRFAARPEMLVQILHGFLEHYRCVPREAIPQIASALNLSRADVHGVVSFYHDFREHPPGDTVIRICQAESCQAMGSRALTEHAKKSLNIDFHQTSNDGTVTLEPVYCLGNCACSPAVMINDRIYGRVDNDRLDRLLAEGRG